MELFRFFLGEGEPTCELVPLDVEFSVGKGRGNAEHSFCWIFERHILFGRFFWYKASEHKRETT